MRQSRHDTHRFRRRLLTSGAVAPLLWLPIGCTSQAEPAAQPSGPLTQAGSASAESASGRVHRDTAKLSARASDAAEVIASGDGLRVVNRSADDVWLVFPDHDRVQVKAGRHVVVHRPCRETLPLRAEVAGAEVAVHRGPCRPRDAWVID